MSSARRTGRLAPRIARALLRFCLPDERRDDVDADLIEELETRAAGASPRAVRRWYRRQVLGFALARLRAAMRGPVQRALCPSSTRWIAANDLRVAVRQARRRPVASLTAILALAAAIGLSVAVFTFARGMLFPELPAPEGTGLHVVRVSRPRAGIDRARPAEAAAWLAGASTVEAIGAFEFVSPPFGFDDEAGAPVDGARVTPGPFARISPAPLLGRHLSESDAPPGARAVVVIGERLWRARLGADPDVIGRVVRLGGNPHTVVGVLPHGWRFPATQELWLPLPLRQMAAEEAVASAGSSSTPSTPRLATWAVIGDDVPTATVAAELTGLVRGLPADPGEGDATVLIDPYVDGFSGNNGRAIVILVLGVLLAFVCGVSLNVANLILAHCAARSGELSVRVALGASRSRIAAQLFIEALVLGGIAAAIGTLAARLGVDWIRAQIGSELPFWIDLSIGPVVLLFAAVAAVVTSALAGVVPALRLTRRRSSARILQAGSSGAAVAMPGRFAAALPAAQLALSLGFLALAILLVEGLLEYTRVPAVAGSDRILTAVLYRDPTVSGSDATWGSAELHALRTEIETALRAIPGAGAAAVSLSLPRAHNDYGVARPDGAEERGVVRAQSVFVGPGFFEVLGVAPTSGRTFTDADARPGAPRVAVVSERFAAAAFGIASPLGRRLRWLHDGGEAGDAIEIVGVVDDLGMDPGDRSAGGEVYAPLVGSNFLYAAVRVDGNPLSIAPALQQVVAGVDPAIRLTDVQRLADVGWEARALLGAGSTALAGLGGMALLLSLAGIYALATLVVTCRTREIGIRVALGASRRSVLRSVLQRSLLQLGLGTLGGLALALLFQRITEVLPFAIPGRLTAAVPGLAGLMLVAGLLASWIPARRALAVDPVEALRRE